jgi:hypothetical protein
MIMTSIASAVSEPTMKADSAPVGRLVRKVVWTIALAVMALAAMNGYLTIEIQESAPQQAAAGAISCFYMIAPYVVARAIDHLAR